MCEKHRNVFYVFIENVETHVSVIVTLECLLATYIL